MAKNNSYKDSLKATTLFGGVQVYSILIGIIRSKFIAVLLGPAGMGISGLLSSTTGLISSFTSCGLSTSAVRDVSEAHITGDQKRISLIIAVLKRLVWITGLVGALVCLIFAPYWSKLTFGNNDYTIGFIILSLSILITQLTSGQNVILQGLQKYAYLAKANLFGNTIGLLITIPLYYYWGINAIVPVLLLSSLTSFLLTSYYSRKIKIESVPLTTPIVKKEGKSMLRMGIFISLQSLFAMLVAYIVRIFISNTGGVGEVGLYAAGFTIVNTYVGLIFNAMGTDYYPRLSAVSKENSMMSKLVNEQSEIAIILLSPIIISFIIYIRLIVKILYSNKFIPVEGMIYWAIFAIFFKALSWTISFCFLSKADTKLYFWSEFSASSYTLLFNIIGYHFFGLTGLGISFFAIYVIYFLQVWIICKKKYQLHLNKNIFKLLIPQFILSVISICLVLFTSSIFKYSVGTLLFFTSCYLAYYELNKRVNIKSLINNSINHFSKK